MTKLVAIIIGLMPMVTIAEHWLTQLPITSLGTNSTGTIQSSIVNHGIIKGVYIDITGSESALFTNTLYASSAKGDRVIYSSAVASVSTAFVTNIASALFEESLKLVIVSPTTATNSVSINAVVLYEE